MSSTDKEHGAGYDLTAARQHGRMEVASEIDYVLRSKRIGGSLTEEENAIAYIVDGIICRMGATIEEAGSLGPLFGDLTPDAEALRRMTHYEADGYQLIRAGSARNSDVGPAKLSELESRYGKENVRMYMEGATDRQGKCVSLVMIWVKKSVLEGEGK